MKCAKVFGILLAAGVLFLPACGAEEEAGETDVPNETAITGRVYSYREAETALEWDKPGFTLYEDGTFYFYFSAISSYVGLGTYELNEETLVLTTNDGNYEYCFTAAEGGDSYVFDKENSSKVTHFAEIPDGARFW